MMPVGAFRRIMFVLAGTAHHAQHGGTACAEKTNDQKHRNSEKNDVED
jgi:hypothetical protein